MFVLCNTTNVDEVRAWAADPRLSGGHVPPANVLSNGSEDTLGLAGDLAALHAELAAAGRPLPPDATLLIAEADAVCGPGFAASRLVEHACVRGKDTLSYMAAPAGMALEGQAVVLLEDPVAAASSASCMMVGMDPVPAGLVGGAELVAVLAPVAVLRPDTLERVAAAAAASPSTSGVGGGLIGGLVAQLMAHEAEQQPMYAMPVDCFFRVDDAYNVALTSNFWGYYANERAGVKGEAAKALEAARRLAALNEARTMAGGSLAAAVRLLEEQERCAPPEPCVDAGVRKVFKAFWGGWLRGDRHYDTGANVGHGGVTALGMSRSGGTTALPVRFADVTTRRYAIKGQHPVYSTTSNEYGRKVPGQLDMPLIYAGCPQTFTKSFPVTAPKSSNLVTAVTRSKVHKALDDF